MVNLKKPFCVALTGGIGSGKSTVSSLFAKLGATIIDADEIAHRLTKPNGAAYHTIIDHFGPAILQADKMLDRKRLREIIFSDAIEKKWLENTLHPLIRQTMRDEIAQVKKGYCICVIPLLRESSAKEVFDFIDHILVVDTPLELQINRVQKRDGSTRESIQKIIESQIKRDARIKMADHVLVNEDDIPALTEKVKALHHHYLTLIPDDR